MLICAGSRWTVFDRSSPASLRSSVATVWSWLTAESRIGSLALRDVPEGGGQVWGSVGQGGQGPAPAGQLAGDGGAGDGVFLLAGGVTLCRRWLSRWLPW